MSRQAGERAAGERPGTPSFPVRGLVPAYRSPMKDERLQCSLGWGSVGTGLVLLAFAGRVCRLMRLPGRTRLVRALGVRDVLIGLGVVRGRHRLPWLWARSLSDALDTAYLWKTVRQRPHDSSRRALLAVGGLGLTLVDLAGVRREVR
jgi:hypothetical protein